MIKSSIINIAIFASIFANSLHASNRQDDQEFSFKTLNHDTQRSLTEWLDEESLATLAHTEKAGTWMVLRELQTRFPAYVESYQNVSKDLRLDYRFNGKFIKPSVNAPQSFFFLSSFPFLHASTLPSEETLAGLYDQFLRSTKPMLKVALLLPPTQESMLCGIQGVHLLLGRPLKTPCQILNNYYFEKDFQPFADAKMSRLKPSVISNLGYICEGFIKVNTQEELADICYSMFATSKMTLCTPRFRHVRAAGKALLKIKDFVYYPTLTHSNVIRALETGKIISIDTARSDASLMNPTYELPLIDIKIPPTLKIKTDRPLEQKSSDFDLMRQVCLHAINELGFPHSQVEDGTLYLNLNFRNAVFNEKQAELFKKRHLDKSFQ